MIDWTLFKTGTCKSFKEVPKGAIVEWVNGKLVRGRCESCGKYILHPNQPIQAGDHEICQKCVKDLTYCVNHGKFKKSKRAKKKR